ncbi:hypothetical protein [Azospirillum lipoferum]|uniref:hypothetical protein n=1 Tax=Azospirillum lipoferum TaxID=193 RepID=UPI0013961574|nr:hypothetical protein [Azospirillum lipoferum]
MSDHAAGASKAILKTINELVERGFVKNEDIPNGVPSEKREAVYELLLRLVLEVDRKSTYYGVKKGLLLALSMYEDGCFYKRGGVVKVRRAFCKQEIPFRKVRGGVKLQDHRKRDFFRINIERILVER